MPQRSQRKLTFRVLTGTFVNTAPKAPTRTFWDVIMVDALLGDARLAQEEESEAKDAEK